LKWQEFKNQYINSLPYSDRSTLPLKKIKRQFNDHGPESAQKYLYGLILDSAFGSPEGTFTIGGHLVSLAREGTYSHNRYQDFSETNQFNYTRSEGVHTNGHRRTSPRIPMWENPESGYTYTDKAWVVTGSDPVWKADRADLCAPECAPRLDVPWGGVRYAIDDPDYKPPKPKKAELEYYVNWFSDLLVMVDLIPTNGTKDTVVTMKILTGKKRGRFKKLVWSYVQKNRMTLEQLRLFADQHPEKVKQLQRTVEQQAEQRAALRMTEMAEDAKAFREMQQEKDAVIVPASYATFKDLSSEKGSQ